MQGKWIHKAEKWDYEIIQDACEAYIEAEESLEYTKSLLTEL